MGMLQGSRATGKPHFRDEVGADGGAQYLRRANRRAEEAMWRRDADDELAPEPETITLTMDELHLIKAGDVIVAFDDEPHEHWRVRSAMGEGHAPDALVCDPVKPLTVEWYVRDCRPFHHTITVQRPA